jgi:hypothetical protein
MRNRIWLVVGCFGRRKKLQFQHTDRHSLSFPLMGFELLVVGSTFLSLSPTFLALCLENFHTNKLVVMCHTIGSNSPYVDLRTTTKTTKLGLCRFVA